MVVSRQKSCGPLACPTPPTSSQTGREPYLPDWAATLLGAVSGKLLLLLESGIHYFRGQRSGYLRYNAADETVSVDDGLQFTSNIPQATDFGFVAKVIPGLQRTCDEEGNAVDVTTQELASQITAERDDGAIMLGNVPSPGQVVGNGAADLQNQLRFDRLLPPVYNGSAAGLGFLVRVPETVLAGSTSRVISKWALMQQVKLRQSHLGMVEPGSADATAALGLVAIRIPGGTEQDPLFALKILNQEISPLPTEDLEVGDTVEWDGTKWIPVRRGLRFYPLTSSQRIASATASATTSVTFPDYPAAAVGKVFARLRIYSHVACSGGQLTFSLRINNIQVAAALTNASGYSNDANQVEATVELTAETQSLVFTKVGSGYVTCLVDLMGYEY